MIERHCNLDKAVPLGQADAVSPRNISLQPSALLLAGSVTVFVEVGLEMAFISLNEMMQINQAPGSLI